MPVLVLTNEEIKTLVPISAYVDAIEAAYREFGLGRAVIQPRTDLYGESPAENRYCVQLGIAGEEKTRVCKVPEGEFDFLGYTFGRMYSARTGQARLGYRPSKKSSIRFL